MTLDDSIQRLGSQAPNTHHGERLCAIAGGSVVEAANTIAIRTAQMYLDGRLEFDAADGVMSSLFGYVTIDANLPELPEPMYTIFLAFDAGEYRHAGDTEGLDPREKYTTPMLLNILSRGPA